MLGLFALSLTFTSCKKDGVTNKDSKTCVDASQEWSDAVMGFGFNPATNTEEQCETWKSAWKTFTDKCNIKDILSDEEYQEYLDAFSELDCSDFQ